MQILLSDFEIRYSELRKIIDRLIKISKNYDRIIDFGFGTGRIAMALAFGLGSFEIVGVDKEIDSVDRAIADIKGLSDDLFDEIYKLWKISRDPALQEGLRPKTRLMAEEIVSRHRFQPTFHFIHGDFARGEPVPELASNYFDLAHSRYCLYQIYCSDPSQSSRLESALTEMSRVVKPGGLITVYEPEICPGKQRILDLRDLFVRRQDLTLLHSCSEDGVWDITARRN
jgi:ubiquinone/menaquinone biosynthesis C-methylase UbiE